MLCCTFYTQKELGGRGGPLLTLIYDLPQGFNEETKSVIKSIFTLFVELIFCPNPLSRNMMNGRWGMVRDPS